MEAWRLRTRIALADPTALGLVGSLLVMVGSLGIGITPKPDPIGHLPVLEQLRETGAGQALSTSAVVAGIAVLLTAWLSMGRDLRAGVGPGIASLRRTLLLWAAPLVLTPPLFSRDLYSYAAQGNMVRHGWDIYVMGPSVLPGPFQDAVDPMWQTTPAPYGPLFLSMAGGVSRLTGDSVYLGVLGMRALALLGVLLVALYLPRLAARCGVDPATALWLGLVNPLTVMHFVSGGHNDALMLGFIVAGLALALERRLVLASVAIALAAGVKAPAAVMLGFVGLVWARELRGRHRRWAGFARAGFTGLAAFAALTVATGVGVGWVAALGIPGSVRTWLSPPTAVGMLLGGAGRLLGAGDRTWAFIDATRMVSGVGALIFCVWLLLRRRRVHPVRGAAFALLALVLLGPVVQPWYLMWALVPLAAGGVRAREGRWVMAGVVASVVISQVNGTTMFGFMALPGTAACLIVTWVVVRRARAAEARAFGPDAVFDLAALRPGERRRRALAAPGAREAARLAA